ncbi:MAG: glycosyl hydrolase [Bacteroidota bacterium]|nr:glycosyl hydrolase [Bacteroidota bacterium]
MRNYTKRNLWIYFIWLSVSFTSVQGQAVKDTTWNLDFKTIGQTFANPPNQYRLIQYYTNKNLQENDALDLKSHGIGGIQTSVPYKNYLQDELGWTQEIDDLNLAINKGMRVWIHDERGYPSGAAGGLVVEGHPEFEARGVIRITQKGTGKINITKDLPANIVFFRASLCSVVNGEPDYENATEVAISNNRVQTTGLEGAWQLSVFGVKILDKDTQAQSTPQFGGTGHYPSVINKDATQRFIELTHQNYANHITDIGQKVESFYTAEPNLMTTYWKYDGSQAEYAYIPWEKDLPNQFKAMHGYDLIPRLDALFEGYTTNSKMVRLHFYQTVAEMFASNYAGQITGWCAKNGVQSIGHLLLEEYLACHVIYYGDMMKAQRNFNIPGCDIPIARKSLTNWNFWMPKLISSASYLENKNSMVVALIDPIIGVGTNDLSPDIKYLKRTINMSFLCGINQFSTYIPYTGYTSEEYRIYNEYLGRISLMLRGAKNEASIAMYYPIETFQARYIVSPLPHTKIVANYSYLQATLDRMAADILQNGLDFNYVTADAILNATIKGATIQVGTHQYSTIIMPRVEVIPLDVLKKLKAFSDAGIRVHWVDALPTLGTKNSEHDEVNAISKTLLTNNYPMSDLRRLRDNEFSIHINSNDNKLSVSRFTRDDHRIYYIINDSDNQINITAESGQSEMVEIYNPVNGEIREASLPLSEKIGSYESLFLVEKLSGSTTGSIQIMDDSSEAIKLYPNPSNAEVKIAVPAKFISSTLEIVDLLGRVIENETISREIITKDISGYNAGLYLVRVKGETFTGKLMKL